MEFFDKTYEVPKNDGGYMKFKQGENIFRILAPAVMGWEDWKQDGDKKVPVRTKWEGEQSKPVAINSKRPVKHFWAFPVYTYGRKTIEVLEITQNGIQNSIYTSHCEERFGNPMGYDLKVIRTGEGLETKYEVLAMPPEAMDSKIGVLFAETPVNCEALFTNDDPFEKKEGVVTPNPKLEKELDKDLDNMFPETE